MAAIRKDFIRSKIRGVQNSTEKGKKNPHLSDKTVESCCDKILLLRHNKIMSLSFTFEVRQFRMSNFWVSESLKS